MNNITETPRLLLRELTADDFFNLCESLQDKETMYAYEHAFSDEEVQAWLNKQLASYKQYGFGLWAVIHKKDHTFLGQCGITMQPYKNSLVPEIGYVFSKKYWHNGYAAEAAAACQKHAFRVLLFKEVYSFIRPGNTASAAVARKNGMKIIDSIIKHYLQKDMPHNVYCIQNPAADL